MQPRVKRHLKLVAVVTAVTLALSGFSQARSGGGSGGGKSRSSSGGGGGGCGKDSSSSRSSYNSGYHGTSGSSSGSSGSSGSSRSSSRDREPDVEVVSCATENKGTVVELSDGRSGTYTVRVELVDVFGDVIDTASRRVSVRTNRTERVEVKPQDPIMVGAAEDCRVTVD